MKVCVSIFFDGEYLEEIHVPVIPRCGEWVLRDGGPRGVVREVEWTLGGDAILWCESEDSVTL